MRNSVVIDNFSVQGSYRYIFNKSKKYGLYENCFASFVEGLVLYDKIYLDMPANAGSVESERNLDRHYETLEFFNGTIYEIPWRVNKEIFNRIYTEIVSIPSQKLSVLTGMNKKRLEDYVKGKFHKLSTGIPILDNSDAIPHAKYILQFNNIFPKWKSEILDIHKAELNLDAIDFFKDKPQLKEDHAQFMSSNFNLYNMFRVWVICNSNNANYICNPISKIFLSTISSKDKVFFPTRQIIIEELRKKFKNNITIKLEKELSNLIYSTKIQTSAPNLYSYVTSGKKDPDTIKEKIMELRNSKEAKSYRKWCGNLEKKELGKGNLDVLKEIRYVVKDLQDRFEIKEKPHEITWAVSGRINPLNPLDFIEGSLEGKEKIPSLQKLIRKLKQHITQDKHVDFLSMNI